MDVNRLILLDRLLAGSGLALRGAHQLHQLSNKLSALTSREQVRDCLGAREGALADRVFGVLTAQYRTFAERRLGETAREPERRPRLVLAIRQQTFKELALGARLPVAGFEKEVLACVERARVTVIQAETGSGKTTQIPQILFKYFGSKVAKNQTFNIVVTQPRRVVCIQLAARVQAELRENMLRSGLQRYADRKYVGYKVRFQQDLTEDTQVLFETDGHLVQEIALAQDPAAYLDGIDFLVVDEAHEHSTPTDLLFGLLKKTMARTKTRVLVMSATIDAPQYVAYLGQGSVLQVPGRLFDVETRYMAPGALDAERERTPEERVCFVKAQLRDLILAYYGLESPFPAAYARGTTLVFLPGAEEIGDVLAFCSQVLDGLGDRLLERPPVRLFPLHSRLSMAQQTEALRPEPGAKRIVAATNIAETSLTVPDCSCVIDSALVKVLYYRPQQHCDVLQTTLVDRSSLLQRRGRAGRVAAGLYVCALTEAEASVLEKQRAPEIARIQPDRVVLDIVKLSGGQAPFKDLLQFPLMHPIPYRLLSESVRRLERLRCLRSEAQTLRLTKLGRQVQQFPVDIQMGLALQEARRLGCLADCAKAAAVISAGLQPGPGEYVNDFEGFVDLFDRILLKRAPEVGR